MTKLRLSIGGNRFTYWYWLTIQFSKISRMFANFLSMLKQINIFLYVERSAATFTRLTVKVLGKSDESIL